MDNTLLQQSLDNMRGGCAYNYDGSDRVHGNYSDFEANLIRYVQVNGELPPDNVIKYWNQ